MRSLSLQELDFVSGGVDNGVPPDPLPDPTGGFDALRNATKYLGDLVPGWLGEYISGTGDAAATAGQNAADNLKKSATDTNNAINCESDGKGYDPDTGKCDDGSAPGGSGPSNP